MSFPQGLEPLLAASWLSRAAGLWPVWLPLLAGGAAVFLLLPRPRSYPLAWGALLGVAALVLAGVLLVAPARTAGVDAVVQTVLFYAFAAIALASGTLLVTQRNPARAALSFALVVLSTCGLFLLLAAPFLMAATIIVYAGAIIVTFLFVLMLAQQAGLSSADARSREPLLSVVTGFLLLAALLYVLHLSYDTSEIDALLARTEAAAAGESTEEIKRRLGGEQDREDDLFLRWAARLRARGFPDLAKQAEDISLRLTFGEGPDSVETMRRHLADLRAIGLQARNRLGSVSPPAGAALSNLSGTPPTVPYREVRRNALGQPQLPGDNSAYLGRSLFTDFLLPVELGGMLLLVAAVGAIAIAHRRTAGADIVLERPSLVPEGHTAGPERTV
jgi:NADH:ubiquinone oxidoreductase subunit 6 (subunit J)